MSQILHPGSSPIPHVRKKDADEYTQLVARQYRSGNIGFAISAQGGAGVFAVLKPSGKLREVFNGSKLSAAGAKPPKPPHLVSPRALANIELGNDQRLYLSKRDAEVQR